MASKAGVPYVIPNVWGSDPLDEESLERVGFGKRFRKYLVQSIPEIGRLQRAWPLISSHSHISKYLSSSDPGHDSCVH